MSMRFTVDPWDPSYGSSLDGEIGASDSEVSVELETAAAHWQPISPAVAPPDAIVFVDGVRRVEALGWVTGAARSEPALFASYAAGAVLCNGQARVVDVHVERGVWSASPDVADVETRSGAFRAGVASGGTPEQLSLALQQAMTNTEVATAERCRRAHDALVVLDGPLRGRQHLPSAVGLVKTHHVRYLPDHLEPILEALQPGQRTPLFLISSTWARISWYVRLPGPSESPWAGIVRCEAPVDLAPEAARHFADNVTAALPRYASTPHKDPRAPQNLVPIAGLERELRRRLGDPAIVYRALRRAASAAAVVGSSL